MKFFYDINWIWHMSYKFLLLRFPQKYEHISKCNNVCIKYQFDVDFLRTINYWRVIWASKKKRMNFPYTPSYQISLPIIEFNVIHLLIILVSLLSICLTLFIWYPILIRFVTKLSAKMVKSAFSTDFDWKVSKTCFSLVPIFRLCDYNVFFG